MGLAQASAPPRASGSPPVRLPAGWGELGRPPPAGFPGSGASLAVGGPSGSRSDFHRFSSGTLASGCFRPSLAQMLLREGRLPSGRISKRFFFPPVTWIHGSTNFYAIPPGADGNSLCKAISTSGALDKCSKLGPAVNVCDVALLTPPTLRALPFHPHPCPPQQEQASRSHSGSSVSSDFRLRAKGLSHHSASRRAAGRGG